MSIDRLKPAEQQFVSFYLPYFQGNRRMTLPIALSLYQRGVLEGQRKIEGSEDVPFVATWNVSTLPVDLTRCRLQFDSNPELSYETIMASSELVDYLIDVVLNFNRDHTTDFPTAFYRKLLHLDE
ncbi:MAG: hypothetical protein JOZ78_09610 [Chroococcidiopsidaceae cyanobacterium CP_BM_ER_R8_30]|nr:hypothetical protein [Chroococcidiopsidaceae cyanobacterium CP_BM_ER_R8_30]